MRKIQLVAIIGISLVAIIMIPPGLTTTVFAGYFDSRECFETKEFVSRAEGEKEYDRWKTALGDKFAGFDFNGLSEKTIVPTSMTVCVFANR